MKSIRYISKGIAILLLLVIGETYYCSASCAIGADNCCSAKATKDDCCKDKNSCCEKEESAPTPDNSCQKDHLEFFKTVGKFFGDNGVTSVDFFQTAIVVILSENNWNITETNFSLFNANGFHPPPPNDEVTVFTHTFRI